MDSGGFEPPTSCMPCKRASVALRALEVITRLWLFIFELYRKSMQKILIGFVAALIVLTPFAAAHESSIKAEDLQSLADKYNSDLDKVPGIIKTVAGNERANLHISYPDGDEDIIGFVMKDGKMESVSDGAVENPTINFYTKSENVDKILKAEDPFLEAGKSFSRNEVVYSGVGLFDKIKVWLVRFVLSTLGFIIFPTN